jgi:hypothetical protein
MAKGKEESAPLPISRPMGLWVGNGSSGDFANLTLTPKKS